MPSCPNCGTAVATPTKTFTVIVEPKEGERGLTQRKVGMYTCEKCGTKFPTVMSRQHYLVVAEEQLSKIQTDVKNLKKTNQDLEKRIEAMDKEYAELQREAACLSSSSVVSFSLRLEMSVRRVVCSDSSERIRSSSSAL